MSLKNKSLDKLSNTQRNRVASSGNEKGEGCVGECGADSGMQKVCWWRNTVKCAGSRVNAIAGQTASADRACTALLTSQVVTIGKFKIGRMTSKFILLKNGEKYEQMQTQTKQKNMTSTSTIFGNILQLCQLNKLPSWHLMDGAPFRKLGAATVDKKCQKNSSILLLPHVSKLIQSIASLPLTFTYHVTL